MVKLDKTSERCGSVPCRVSQPNTLKGYNSGFLYERLTQIVPVADDYLFAVRTGVSLAAIAAAAD